ncbi:hypothetical protein FJZ36_05820, partial [Candidatus Poribacteria bacterium]|nr:hypothetical protein [Candidatus Poribacteria bacterium]
MPRSMTRRGLASYWSGVLVALCAAALMPSAYAAAPRGSMSSEYYRPRVTLVPADVAGAVVPANGGLPLADNNWKIALNASGQYVDRSGILRDSSLLPLEFGIHPSATNGFDVLIDFLAPPPHPSPKHPDGYLENLSHAVDFRLLATDLRSMPADAGAGLSWTAVIRNNADTPWTLAWSADGLPALWKSLTITPAGGTAINMLTTTSLVVPAGGITTRYTITARSDATPPTITASTDQGIRRVAFTPSVTATDNVTPVASLTYLWTGPAGVTFAPNNALATSVSASTDGPKSITLTVTDQAGNAASQTMSFLWDTASPTVAAGSPAGFQRALFTQTGSATDATSDVATYAWSQVSGSGTVTFGTPAAASTSVTASADGPYVIRLTATDAAGNVAFADTNFTWDATVPVVNAGTPADFQRALFTQTGSATDATSDVATYAWSQVSGSGTVTFGAPAAASTSVTASADGPYVIRLTATDAAGNVAFADTNFTWDATVPVVNAGTPADFQRALFTQTGSATDATSDVATYAWSQVSGSGTVTFGAPAAASTSVTASADGPYVIRLTATDAAGNVAFADTNFTWDTALPTVVLPASLGAYRLAFTPTGVSATDSSTPLAYHWTSPTGAVFSPVDALLPLVSAGVEGDHSVTLTVTDAAGNARSSSATFRWDTRLPTLAAPTSFGVFRAPFTTSGVTATDASALTYSWTSPSPAVAFSLPNALSTSISATADADHTATIRATDAAGNFAEATIAFRWDTTPPSVSVAPVGEVGEPFTPAVTASDNLTTVGSLAFKWSGPTGIAFSSTTLAAPTIEASANGGYSVTLSVTDTAGNATTVDVPFTWNSARPSLTADADQGVHDTPFFPVVSAVDPDLLTFLWTVPENVVVSDPTALVPEISALVEGHYVLTLTATDALEQSTSVTMTFAWDVTPPIASGPSSQEHRNKAFEPTYTVADTVATADELIYEWSSDEFVFFSAPGAAVTTISATTFGLHSVTLTVIDQVGHTDEYTFTFTWDVDEPLIALVPDQGDFREAFTPDVEAVDDITAAASLEFEWSGPPEVSFSNSGILLPTITASADGVYEIALSVYDLAGNVASATTTFVWDTTPPIVEGPADQGIHRVPFAPDVIASDALSPFDGLEFAWVADSRVHFSDANALSPTIDASEDAVYELGLSVIDLAGNVTHVPMEFVWDTTAPAITITAEPALPVYLTPFTATATYEDLAGIDLESVLWKQTSELGTVSLDTPKALSTVVVADRPGEYAISVSMTDLAGNVGTKTLAFVWSEPITIRRAIPAFAKAIGGDTIVIEGSGFANPMRITVAGSSATGTVGAGGSSVTITAPPAAPGPAGVEIESRFGTPMAQTASAPGIVTYLAAPTIAGVEPATGSVLGGVPARVSGTGFRAEARLFLGETAISDAVVAPPSSITFTVPPGREGALSVRVVNDTDQPYSQQATAANAFTYVKESATATVSPRFSTLSGGVPLTITSAGLPDDIVVAIAGTAIPATRVSPTTVTTLSPERTEPGPVGMELRSARFATPISVANAVEYLPRMAISSVTPKRSLPAGGETLTIEGSGFRTPAVVFLGSARLTPSTVEPTSITLAIPPGTPGVVGVRVVTDTGEPFQREATLAAAFEYVPDMTFTGIEPKEGPVAGGTEVTILGSGFSADAQVLFGTTPASVVSRTPSLRVTSPASGTAGPVGVTVVNFPDSPLTKRVTLENAFTYTSPMSLTSLSPKIGSSDGGTVVTITGAGFLADGRPVVLFGTARVTPTAITPTTLTVTVPKMDSEKVVSVTVVQYEGTPREARLVLEKAFEFDTPPVVSDVTLTSAGPEGKFVTNAPLTVSYVVKDDFDDPSTLPVTIRWIKNGATIPGETGTTLRGNLFRRGDTISVEVFVVGSSGRKSNVAASAPTKILNTPPTKLVASLIPANAAAVGIGTTTSLGVRIDGAARDIDEDRLTVKYVWSKDGTPQPDITGAILESTKTRKGESWTVAVSANDGEADGEAVVLGPVRILNAKPVLELIRAQSIDEGKELTFTARGTDTDPGDAELLAYSMTVANRDAASPGSLDPVFSIDPKTGVVTFTLSEIRRPTRAFMATITVSDGLDEATQDVLITVLNVNKVPVLTLSATEIPGEVGVPLTITATATDGDGEAITLRAFSPDVTGTSHPGFNAGIAAFNSATATVAGEGVAAVTTKTLTVTPSAAAAGNIVTLNFIARDGNPGSQASVSARVTFGAVNLPPVVTVIPEQAVNENQLFSLNLSPFASDPEGQPLFFTSTSLPRATTLNETTGVIEWQTTFDDSKSYSIAVNVRDRADAAAPDVQTTGIAFTLVVRNVNRAPQLEGAPAVPITLSEGDSQSLLVRAFDPDNEPVVFLETVTPSLPSYIRIATRTRSDGVYKQIEINPRFGDTAGTTTIQLHAEDAGKLAADASIGVTLVVVNRPPVPGTVPAQFAQEGTTHTFGLTSTDVNPQDATKLSVRLTNTPAGATLTLGAPGSATFSWDVPSDAIATLGASVTLNFVFSDGTVEVPLDVPVTFVPGRAEADVRPLASGVSASGAFGDIGISFTLEHPDPAHTMGVEVSYRAIGESAWQPATIVGSSAGLLPGAQRVVWSSAADVPGRGSYQVQVLPTDDAEGIAGLSSGFPVDNEPLLAPTLNAPTVSGSTVAFGGTAATSGGEIELTVFGIKIATSSVGEDLSFAIKIAMPDGEFPVVARHARSGRTGPDSKPVTVVVDTTPPRFVMISPEADADGVRRTTSRTPRIVFSIDGGRSGIVPESLTAIIDGAAVAPVYDAKTSSATLPTTTDLVNGHTYVVVIRGRNKTGLEGSGLGGFIVQVARDRKGPTITAASPSSGSRSAATSVDVIVTVTDDSGIDARSTTLTLDDAPLTISFTATDASGGEIRASAAGLVEGEHHLRLNVFDTVGNSTERRWPFQVIRSRRESTKPLATVQQATRSADYALSGTTAPQSLVSLVVNGNVASTTVADSTGAWSLTARLSVSRNTIQAFSTDQFGARAAVSDTYEVVYDTVAPVVSLLSPVFGGKTPEATPTFRGTVTDALSGLEAGRVTATIDGVPVEIAYDVASGAFQFSPAAPLTNGSTATVAISATDLAGNAVTRSGQITVDATVADTSPPIVSSPTVAGKPFATGAALAVSSTTPRIAVVVTDESAIDQVTGKLDGADVAFAVEGSVASLTPPTLAPGKHSVSVVAKDAKGNVSPARNIEFVVDVETSTPVFQAIASPTNQTSVQVRIGSVEPGASVALTWNGVPVAVRQSESDATTVVSNEVALSDGANRFAATSTDAAGNLAAAAPMEVVLDTRPPQIIVAAPLNESTVAAAFRDFRATFSDANGVDLNSLEALLDGSVIPAASLTVSDTGLSYTHGAALAPHETVPSHVFTVTLRDKAGNQATQTSTFTVDATPPDIVGLDPQGSIGTLEPIVSATIRGTDTDEASIKLLIGPDGGTLSDVSVSASYDLGTGQVTYVSPPLVDQTTYRAVLEVRDVVGNAATREWTFTVETGSADTAPPQLTIGFPQPGSTINNTNLDALSFQLVDGNTGIDEQGVTLYINDPAGANPLGLTTLEENGIASFNRTTGEVRINLRRLFMPFAPRGGGFSLDPLELNALERSLGGGGASFDPLELNALERSLGGGGASFDPLELNALERSLGGGGASFDPLELNALERSLGGGSGSFDPLELNALERSLGGGGQTFDPQQLTAIENSLAAGGLLGVGENVFAVQASDKEGNVTFLEWRFTIVTDPPSKP